MTSKTKIAGQTIKVFFKDPGLFLSLLINIARVTLMRTRFLLTGKKWVIIALTEHIGDLVAAEPLVGAAKNQFPKASLLWVAGRRYAILLKNNKSIDKLITVTSFSEWLFLRKFVPIYHLHDLHIDGKVCGKHFLQYKRKQPITININNFFEFGNLLHAFSVSGEIPVDDTAAPHLHLSKEFALPSSPYVVMHTTSNNPLRDVSTVAWNEIAAHVLKFYPGLTIVELGFHPQVKPGAPGYMDATSTRDLSYIAALIRNCDLYIGIDSGFAHMANACNKEALIFIGHYLNFKNYMPYSGKFQAEREQQLYYFDGQLKNLRLNDIQNRLDQKLSRFKTRHHQE